MAEPENDSVSSDYEPPQLVDLGPVEEATLGPGGGASAADG